MKTLRTISTSLLGMLLLVLISSCNEETIVNFNSDTTVPRDLSLLIVMDEDVKGKVTISPTATAANKFEILFGDVDGESPTEVAVGGSVDHTYGEGVFLVQLVATGVSGETSTTSAVVEMSFDPVANFEAMYTPNADNPTEITFTASADNATMFEVTFGEDPDADPVSFLAGESTTYTYSAEGDYTATVTAIGCDAVRPTIDLDVSVVIPTDPIVLPLDFELDPSAYAFGSFGDAGAGVVANPDMNGNPSAQVGEFNKPVGAQTWAGTSILLSEAIDFSSEQLFSMKIWSPIAGATFMMKIENADDNSIAMEIPAVNTVTSGWEELTFDFSAIDQSQVYQRIVLFFNFDVEGDGSLFYFDDITQGAAVAPSVSFPLDFEQAAAAYPFQPFGDPVNAGIDVVANPNMNGNASAQVAQFTKPSGAPTWAGVSLLMDDPIDFSSTQVFKMMVWSPKVGAEVLFKFENADDGSISQELMTATTVANQWEELTWDFSGLDLSATYQRLALFFDFGVDGDDSVYYFDNVDQGEGGGTGGGDFVLIEDFEGAEPTFDAFGGLDFPTVIDNPGSDAVNGSSKVLSVVDTDGSMVWGGCFWEATSPFTFGGAKQVRLKVWSPATGIPMLIKMENIDANVGTYEVRFNTSVANGWEEVTLDFSAAPDIEYSRVVVFPNFPEVGDIAGDGTTYYFDHFEYTSN